MTDNGFRDVKLNIGLDNQEPYENLFQKWYSMILHNDFIESEDQKKHNMNNHSKRFRDKIKLNHDWENLSEIRKWKVVLVNFGMNIWTEINWVRPAIIYKHDDYRYWEDIVVIPITSYESNNSQWDDEIQGQDLKSKDMFDIAIDKSMCDGLDHDSLIKIRQLKSVSKKRFRRDRKSKKIKIIWFIQDEEIKKKIDR